MPQKPPAEPEIRVEITGDLPIGTRWIHASLIANPAYCDQFSDDSCGQVYQTVEFDPAVGRVFRVTIPEPLRAFEFSSIDKGTGRASLRVEARADDHCLLARGTRLVQSDTVALDLAPTATRLCTIFLVMEGTSSAAASVKYDNGTCPVAPLDIFSNGTLCVTEQPMGVPLKLQAVTANPNSYIFGRWEGFPDCATRTQPDCTLPSNGPAAVRAVFRAR